MPPEARVLRAAIPTHLLCFVRDTHTAARDVRARAAVGVARSRALVAQLRATWGSP